MIQISIYADGDPGPPRVEVSGWGMHAECQGWQRVQANAIAAAIKLWQRCMQTETYQVLSEAGRAVVSASNAAIDEYTREQQRAWEAQDWGEHG